MVRDHDRSSYRMVRDGRDKTKRADVIANVIEQTWFNRYPWPTQVVLDRGTEFMAEFTEMIRRDYGVTKRPITIGTHKPME